MTKPTVLFAHPWVGNGGSEATTMWAIQALQDDFDITLVTAADVDFDFLNRSYGCSVKADLVKLIKAPRLPGVTNGHRLVALQHAYFHRFCRSIAKPFDLCVSGYNFVPFGRPGIQLIGDFSFSEELRKKYYVQNFQKIAHRKSLIRSLYIALTVPLAGVREPFSRQDLVLANSCWTASKLIKHFQLECDVIYPPVSMSQQKDVGEDRDPYSFFYIGRVAPEKEVEKIINILDKVRAQGYPVTLELAGNSGRSEYEMMITELAAGRDWVTDLGYLNGKQKEQAFARNSFGLQACQCEAFGIAAAEMGSRGCLPLVAAGCGTAEVVPHRELQFKNEDDAVRKIRTLLDSPELTGKLRKRVLERSSRFSATEFVVNFRNFVNSMQRKGASSLKPANVVNQKDCSAVR